MNKFYCIECGENEVDDEDDICDECAEAYNDDDEDWIKEIMKNESPL